MSELFQTVLNRLPPRATRSRLEPFRELIDELRRRNRTYEEIAQALRAEFGVSITASGVHDFVRRHVAQTRPPVRSASPAKTIRGPSTAAPETPKTAADEVFEFDASQPLKLNGGNQAG